MSGDYLYDKEGEDESVEKLERSLGGLKYDGAPPELPHAPERAEPGSRPRAVPTPPRYPQVPIDAYRPRAGWLGGRTPLAIAAVLAVCSGLVSFSAIKKKEADVRRGWNLVPVVVAAADLAEGSMVTFDMLSQRSVPEQFVTASVVKPDSASYVVNQKVLVPVQAGDPLLWSQFETTRAAERLSTKVQKKARAITLEAGKTTAVGGWIRPNDHIDLIGTFKDPKSNESVAVTLLQNVIVLSTGKITGTTNVNLVPEAQREYSNVSLLVIPEEAEILVLATQLGGLTMSLRNEEDVDVIEERGRATIDSLLSGERTRVLQQKRFTTISIIRGSGDSKK